MITIFSITNDQTTTQVIRWLNKFGRKDVVRINGDEPNIKFKSLHFKDSDIIILKEGQEIDLKKTTTMWYRKGRSLFNDRLKLNFSRAYFSDGDRHLNNNIKNELNVLSDYIHHKIESGTAYNLGSKFNSSLNKLKTLAVASEEGMDIPDSYVVESREEIRSLLSSNESLITKALSDGIYLFFEGYAYYSYTEKITEENLKDLPEVFFPSLLQGQVAKSYEIRAFYLEGRFYSMAILSQTDKTTEVDFRKYNGVQPNRNIPYKLPSEVEAKLKRVFEKLGLNTGSADIIKSKDGKYVFLEINPVGQFSMVSQPCNYYLEKEVASLLAKQDQ